MGVKSTPEEAAADWASGLANAVPKIERRVRAVTEAPGAKAAAQKDAWRQNVSTAADKWARKVGAVSLEDWRQATLEKGVVRIAGGAEAARSKMQGKLEQVFRHENALMDKIDRMPKRTLQDSVARATAWITGMADLEVD